MKIKPPLYFAIYITIYITIVFFLCILPYKTTKADTNNELKEAVNSYGIQQYDESIQPFIENIEPFKNMSFSQIVLSAMQGKLNFTAAISLVIKTAFKELTQGVYLIKNAIIIAILGALIKSVNAGFSENSVNQIGFYVIYTALVSILITSFVSSAQIASNSIAAMTHVMQLLIPLIIALLAASGRYAISFVFNPSAMLVIEIAAHFINTVLLKVIIFTAIIQMVNFLTPHGALDNMTKLAFSLISKGLKWLSVIFMGFITLETISAPLAGSLIGKSAKIIVKSVPVVGGAFAGAVDSVFIWGHAVKNATAIATIIVILFICSIPIVKLLALAFIYTAASALIEPFADDRAVSLLEAAGKYTLLFAGAVMCVCVMLTTLLMMVMAGAIG